MNRIKEFFGQCQYHYGSHANRLRVIQLTPDNNEWQHAIAICSDCRKQLRGHFRYAKSINSKYEWVKLYNTIKK